MARRCVFGVVLAVLLLCVCCEQPATVTLNGDGAQVVWKDAGGGQVVSLKRNGSSVVLDSPLRAQEVRANDVHSMDISAQELYVGNASFSASFEMLMNVSDRINALAEANANLSAEVDSLRAALLEVQQKSKQTALSLTWDLNDNWFDLEDTVATGLAGFIGGFSASDFAYYVPFRNTADYHGNVVRISMSDFSPSGVEWFDLATVNSSLKGFYHGFAAGDFAYYVPHFGDVLHGRVVRINTSNFTSGGVEWFDLAATVDAGLVGFKGGFAAGGFAYYVPDRNVTRRHGNLVRINMSDFSPSGVEWIDLAKQNASLAGFVDGFAGGDFAYCVPYLNNAGYHGNVVRINMSNFTSAGMEWFDLAATVDAGLVGFRGGFAAGAFAYYVPFRDISDRHGRVVRINMSDFSPSGVEWFDLETTVNEGLKGFTGGFAVGDVAYYVPHHDGSVYHGKLVRITMSDFSPSGVDWFDLASKVNPGLVGCAFGFAAGDFAYYVPFQDGTDFHGRGVRVQM